jgi:hypothetical protein
MKKIGYFCNNGYARSSTLRILGETLPSLSPKTTIQVAAFLLSIHTTSKFVCIFRHLVRQ